MRYLFPESSSEPRFWWAYEIGYAQDWLFVISKFNIHAYIIEGLFLELFDEG